MLRSITQNILSFLLGAWIVLGISQIVTGMKYGWIMLGLGVAAAILNFVGIFKNRSKS